MSDSVKRPQFREDESSQIPAIQLLENLGWTYLEPEEVMQLRGRIPRDIARNVILDDVLEKQLRKLNKINFRGQEYEFSEVNVANAIYELKNVPFEGLIKTNEKIFDLLTLGKSYNETIKGDRKSYNFRYIDWETPENNVYHVADEFVVERVTFDGQKRYPDLVLFVNGIPLVVIECKRQPDKNVPSPIEEAISQQIRNQKNTEIPNLFVYSQILLAISPTNLQSKKHRCMYATTGTSRPFWFPWKFSHKNQDKRLKELEKHINKPLSEVKKNKIFGPRYEHARKYFDELEKSPRKPSDQDRMLYGLCEKNRLLEIIKKFTVFDGGIKKVARYQQYFAVKDTLERIGKLDSEGKRENGVVWHTQGSGKSLSMVMLAKAIVMDEEERFHNPKVVLITDRVDLDDQIYRTFQNCGVPLFQATSGAGERDDRSLEKILDSNKASVVATTIFKFDTVANTKNLKLDSPDIIILVDEAHRTQYGEANAKVHQVLPKACFVAFTGTPITKKHKNTMVKFNKIIGSPYTNRDALDDNAVVPLLFEGRIVPQTVNKKMLDNWFDRMTRGLTEEQKADLKQKHARADLMAKTDQRVFMVAADISEHFSRNWKGRGFKGQLAVDGIATAIKFKQYFDEIGEISTAVVVSKKDDRSGHQNIEEEETALQKYYSMIKKLYGNERRYEKAIKEKFDSDDAPDVLIVVSKLLTGFDVPRNTVLYIDKNLEGHTLLQATARVNRPYEGKDYGIIIDYYGNLKNFREAIAHYDELAEKEKYGDFDNFDREEIESAIHEAKEEIAKLPQYYDDLTSLFSSIKNKQDMRAYEDALFEKDDRERFYGRLSQFGRALHLALSSVDFYNDTSDEVIKKYKSELKFFVNLKAVIKEVFSETIDYKDYEPKIEKLLNTHVQAEEVRTHIPMFDIFEHDFESELEGKGARSQALLILTRTKKFITDNLERDRVFYQKYSDLVEETLEAIKKKRDDEKGLLEIAKDIREKVLSRTGDQLPEKLESEEEAKAYFGIVKEILAAKTDSEKINDEELADMSIGIDRIIKENIIVDWTKNIDVQNRIKNRIEDFIFEFKADKEIELEFDSIDRILEEVIKTAKVRCPR